MVWRWNFDGVRKADARYYQCWPSSDYFKVGMVLTSWRSPLNTCLSCKAWSHNDPYSMKTLKAPTAVGWPYALSIGIYSASNWNRSELNHCFNSMNDCSESGKTSKCSIQFTPLFVPFIDSERRPIIGQIIKNETTSITGEYFTSWWNEESLWNLQQRHA